MLRINRQLPVLFLTLFVVMVGFGVVIPPLGYMARDLGASSLQMGLMTTSYAFVQFLFAPIWGSMSDRFGRKRILTVGILGFAFSFLIMGFANSFGTLLLGRVLGGFLSSATLPTAQAFAADLSEPKDRAQVMGFMGAAIGTGFVFGPLLAALLTPFGVHFPFFFSAGLGAVTGILSLVLLREPESRSEDSKPRRMSGFANIKYAIASPLAVFFWVTFAIMFGNSSMFTMLVFFMQDRLGSGQVESSIAFAINGAASAFFQGVLVPVAIRYLGEGKTVRISLGIGAVGFWILAGSLGLPMVYVSMVLIAAGMSFSRPTITSLVSRRTELPQGVTMGMQSSFDSMGRMLGPLWAGYIYNMGISAPYWSAGAVYGIAVIVTYIFAERFKNPEEPLRQAEV